VKFGYALSPLIVALKEIARTSGPAPSGAAGGGNGRT